MHDETRRESEGIGLTQEPEAPGLPVSLTRLWLTLSSISEEAVPHVVHLQRIVGVLLVNHGHFLSGYCPLRRQAHDKKRRSLVPRVILESTIAPETPHDPAH
jgi:hypothetical protein